MASRLFFLARGCAVVGAPRVPHRSSLFTARNGGGFGRGLGGVRMCSSKEKGEKGLKPVQSIPIGMFSGVLASLTGLGGGIVIIPTMAHFTNLSQHTINGTSMLAVTLTSSLGAASYMMQGIVDWPVALAMAVPSLLMTGFGARHARSLNDSKLRLVLGCTLLILCPLIALKDGKEQKEEEPSEGDNKKDGVEEKEREGSSFGEQLEALQKKLDANHFIKDKNLLSLPIPARRALAFANAYGDYLCLGLFSGYSSGLLGIGGGILMTAYMSLKGDMTQLAAVATSLAAIVPIGLSTSFHYTKHRQIHIPSAMFIAGAAMVTCGIASTYVSSEFSDSSLRKLFSLMLCVASAAMIKKGLKR